MSEPDRGAPAARELTGVVLGHVDVGEADRIVRLLCEGEGRVDVMARGARSSRRRFGGALEPGTRVRAVARRGRGTLAWLEEIEVRALPRLARADLDRMVLMHHGCEVIGALAEVGEDVSRELRLLEVWLELLEGEVAPGEASRVAFEAKALTFAGLAPALRLCVACGRALTDPARFNFEDGGGLHAGCGAGEPALAGDLAEIDALRHTPLAETLGAPTPASRWLMVRFIEYQVRRPLRARALLEGGGA
jgi:DNA repair protein RecO (recombination protein O)